MSNNQWRRFSVLALLVATAAALDAGASQSRADFGFGYGFGFGAFNYTTNQGDFLNQRALSGARAERPPSNSVYANNPNSYLNRIRDNGFIPHYSPQSRWSPDYQPVRARSRNVTQTSTNTKPPQQPAMMAPVPRPVVPIGSFFNASRMLIWPSDAPVGGELIVKRDTSDRACLEVADLVGKHGAAPITTVTTTRQKLLDYGQPALHFMRTHTTPRVAETFHLFLLSLYESLAQAVNPAAVTPASNTSP